MEFLINSNTKDECFLMKSLFFLVHVRGHMVDVRCILPASFCAIGHFNVQINVRTGQKGSRIDKRQGKWKDLKSSRTFFNEEANAFDTLVKSPRYKQCILRVKLTVNIALFSKTFFFFFFKTTRGTFKAYTYHF